MENDLNLLMSSDLVAAAVASAKSAGIPVGDDEAPLHRLNLIDLLRAYGITSAEEVAQRLTRVAPVQGSVFSGRTALTPARYMRRHSSWLIVMLLLVEDQKIEGAI